MSITRGTYALLAVLLLIPATALAHHGRHDHGVHRHHGQVGAVKSFDSSTGELVITTTKGRDLSALVTDATHLQCKGTDDDNGDDSTGDDRSFRHGGEGGDDNGHHGHHASKCTTDDLTAGTTVLRARIDLGGDDAEWTKIVLG